MEKASCKMLSAQLWSFSSTVRIASLTNKRGGEVSEVRMLHVDIKSLGCCCTYDTQCTYLYPAWVSHWNCLRMLVNPMVWLCTVGDNIMLKFCFRMIILCLQLFTFLRYKLHLITINGTPSKQSPKAFEQSLNSFKMVLTGHQGVVKQIVYAYTYKMLMLRTFIVWLMWTSKHCLHEYQEVW